MSTPTPLYCHGKRDMENILLPLWGSLGMPYQVKEAAGARSFESLFWDSSWFPHGEARHAVVHKLERKHRRQEALEEYIQLKLKCNLTLSLPISMRAEDGLYEESGMAHGGVRLEYNEEDEFGDDELLGGRLPGSTSKKKKVKKNQRDKPKVHDQLKETAKKSREAVDICDNVSDCQDLWLTIKKALLTRHVKIQEAYWKQKANIQWAKEGDLNTSFFHAVVTGRRRRLTIHRIKTSDDQWIEEEDQIANKVISFYEDLFTQPPEHIDKNCLDCVIKIVTDQDNEKLIETPTVNEIKDTLFSMNHDCAPGPDGVSSLFFQDSWDVIATDLINLVLYFFACHELPRFITHTCLILIPKVNHPESLSDLRPIILANATSKIISKILNNKLAKILPKLISPNQSGFIKGRSTTENIMLTQELAHNMSRDNKGDNAIIKLDMSKTYDRVSWCEDFIHYKMRKQGSCITQLTYADDTILFSSTDTTSIEIIKQRLDDYSNTSEKLIKLGKLHFLHPNAEDNLAHHIMNLTSFSDKNFPFTCLGAPIYLGRKKIEYFNDLFDKVGRKIQAWNGKLMSYGGKAILIKAVLYSIPMHILAATNPPKTTLWRDYIEAKYCNTIHPVVVS
ncbi:uncharacterized protein [Nicotiana sylvestris]|uniref:uncharacterized protein n=1 Tax=Nicotiana sylvestris TaxID=4096 RepID=UPI00388C5DA2